MLNSGDDCHNFILYLASYCLRSKILNIKIYKKHNFICFVLVCNMVSHLKGIAQIKGVSEQGAEDNIWS
jgi:hypothetical protein